MQNAFLQGLIHYMISICAIALWPHLGVCVLALTRYGPAPTCWMGTDKKMSPKKPSVHSHAKPGFMLEFAFARLHPSTVGAPLNDYGVLGCRGGAEGLCEKGYFLLYERCVAVISPQTWHTSLIQPGYRVPET